MELVRASCRACFCAPRNLIRVVNLTGYASEFSHEVRAHMQRFEERAELAVLVLLSKRKDGGLETWVTAHSFARRVTRYAGLWGSGVCRGEATKAAEGCGILEKNRNGGFFTMGTEVKVLRASGRARLGTMRNLI